MFNGVPKHGHRHRRHCFAKWGMLSITLQRMSQSTVCLSRLPSPKSTINSRYSKNIGCCSAEHNGNVNNNNITIVMLTWWDTGTAAVAGEHIIQYYLNGPTITLYHPHSSAILYP